MPGPDDDNTPGIPSRMKEWLRGASNRGRSAFGNDGLRRIGGRIKKRLSNRPSRFEFKKVELAKVAEHSNYIRWGLIVLALFLSADIASRLTGLFFFKASYTPPVRRASAPPPSQNQFGGQDFDAIVRRNMFNVEGKIPQPFDQGLLDCMSQAKPSAQALRLEGTIVMSDEDHSVALLRTDGSAAPLAVKKEESFMDGQYVAKKVERKKFCFQVRSSGEYEYVEIADNSMGLAGPALGGGTEGVTPISDKEFAIKKDFLDKNILNLNEILQTAKAVPYQEPGTGKFMGFLIQSIDPSSPFAQLGVRQGDVLTFVNDIVLDNAGKGLEAFQRLRNSNTITMGIVRGGEKTTLSYQVK